MELPMIGDITSQENRDKMRLYVTALEGMLELHKMNIRDATSKLDRAYAAASETQTINGVYVEQLQTQLSVQCAAISQITGTFALLLASGVEIVPAPTDVSDPTSQEKLN